MKPGRLPTLILLAIVASIAQPATLAWSSESSNPTPSADQPTAQPWWDFSPSFYSTLDRAGEKVSDAVFDQIDNLTLYTLKTGTVTSSISIHRKVFDNADVLGSWTVIDRFHVDGSYPLWMGGMGQLFHSPISFSFGAGMGLDFINVRQVLAKNYASVGSAGSRLDELQKEPWFQEFREAQKKSATEDTPTFNPDEEIKVVAAKEDTKDDMEESFDNGQWVFDIGQDEPNKRKLSFIPEDPQEQARYTKLFNLISFPFRVPLKASSISRLENGEIISYLGTGTVSYGASVGWDLDMTGIFDFMSLGLSYTTYLNGTFQVSILKENDRFVRVKVSRGAGGGATAQLGGKTRPANYDFIVVKAISNYINAIPFDVSVSDTIGRSFDVGYRYDLQNPQGAKAFERAVVGRLVMSDQLAIDAWGRATDFNTSGVSKIFTRHLISSGKSSQNSAKLGFLYRRDAQDILSNVDAIITFPDGTHHMFTATASNSKQWKTVIQTTENMQHNFTVGFDLTKYDQTGVFDDSCTFQMEGRLEDSDTHFKELGEYILEVEDSVGVPQVFPRQPPAGNMGRSRFYYKVGLNCDQVKKFMEYPEEKMWSALEHAFDVAPGAWSTPGKRILYRTLTSPMTLLNFPLHLFGFDVQSGSKIWHAGRIYKRWKKLKEIADIKSRAEGLGRIFFDRYYGYELSKLVRSVLDGENVYYYAAGYTNAMGQIVKEGGSQLFLENIATRVQREIDFERDGPRPPDGDPSTYVQGLNARVLDENRVELSFLIDKEPKVLYFQLSLNNWWWPFHNGELASKLVVNNGTFKKGTNVILLDKTNKDSPWFPMAEKLAIGSVFAFSVASNTDNVHWGPVATTKFRYRVTGSAPAPASVPMPAPSPATGEPPAAWPLPVLNPEPNG